MRDLNIYPLSREELNSILDKGFKAKIFDGLHDIHHVEVESTLKWMALQNLMWANMYTGILIITGCQSLTIIFLIFKSLFESQ